VLLICVYVVCLILLMACSSFTCKELCFLNGEGSGKENLNDVSLCSCFLNHALLVILLHYIYPWFANHVKKKDF